MLMFAVKPRKNAGLRIYPILLICAAMQSAVATESVKIESKAENSHYTATLVAFLGPVPSLFPGEPRFQAIVAYYPWCGALPTWPNKIISPLLVLGAGEDDWVDPEYCVTAREQISGADYDVVVYDKALHSFDLPIAGQVYSGHQLGGDPEATKDSRVKMAEWFLAHRQ